MSEPVVQQRVVPGAPPPLPLSKTQKKRRKAKKTEQLDSPTDAPDSAVEMVPQSAVVQPETPAQEAHAELDPLNAEEANIKSSPTIELINKRLKATTKKISRIAAYAATDPEKLNDDQRATLKSLPALEAVQKELAEIKKTIEVHEAQVARELAAQKNETAKAETAKLAEIVSATESALAHKAADIFLFLRLRSLLASGSEELHSAQIEESEMNAIFAASDVLLGDNAETRQIVINGFLYRDSDFDGIPYSHLVDITHRVLYPPREATPIMAPEEPEDIIEDLSASQSTLDSQVDVTVGGIPSMTASSSFHFMQASELETPSFEDNVEWVDRQEVVDSTEIISEPAVTTNASINGHAVPPAEASSSAPIDWAADDDEGLPSLPSLHAKFGTSGSATPVTPGGETAEEEHPMNGFDNAAPTHTVEDEGFTQARGRGRGRGNRGRGGGFRGERGGRGFRGGGEFRGRGRGEWRGDGHRGDGHRGRGRGRGGDRGGRTEH